MATLRLFFLSAYQGQYKMVDWVLRKEAAEKEGVIGTGSRPFSFSFSTELE
jgi:hypothetical protein